MLKGDREAGRCLITASMETTGQCSEKTGVHRADWAGCNPCYTEWFLHYPWGSAQSPGVSGMVLSTMAASREWIRFKNVWAGQILPATVVREPELRQRGSAAP